MSTAPHTRTLIALGAAAVLAGCAGVTDVVSTGPGTYMIAAHGVMGWSSGAAQKAKAFQQASDYCAGLGRKMAPISSRDTGGGGFGQIAAGEVEFRCE